MFLKQLAPRDFLVRGTGELLYEGEDSLIWANHDQRGRLPNPGASVRCKWEIPRDASAHLKEALPDGFGPVPCREVEHGRHWTTSVLLSDPERT